MAYLHDPLSLAPSEPLAVGLAVVTAYAGLDDVELGAGEAGYLAAAQPGDILNILFVGMIGDDEGWVFASVRYSERTEAAFARGWFPDCALRQLEVMYALHALPLNQSESQEEDLLAPVRAGELLGVLSAARGGMRFAIKLARPWATGWLPASAVSPYVPEVTSGRSSAEGGPGGSRPHGELSGSVSSESEEPEGDGRHKAAAGDPGPTDGPSASYEVKLARRRYDDEEKGRRAEARRRAMGARQAGEKGPSASSDRPLGGAPAPERPQGEGLGSASAAASAAAGAAGQAPPSQPAQAAAPSARPQRWRPIMFHMRELGMASRLRVVPDGNGAFAEWADGSFFEVRHNERVSVLQRTLDDSWAEVRSAAGVRGWVRSAYLRNAGLPPGPAPGPARGAAGGRGGQARPGGRVRAAKGSRRASPGLPRLPPVAGPIITGDSLAQTMKNLGGGSSRARVRWALPTDTDEGAAGAVEGTGEAGGSAAGGARCDGRASGRSSGAAPGGP